MRAVRALPIAVAAITAAALLPTSAGAETPPPDTPPAGGSPAYAWSNVAISGGGYVPGIVYSPTEPDLVYARTDIGGAYRLDAETDEWVPLLDHIGWDEWNRLGVLSLATDPVEPQRVYAAVGTYTNDWDPDDGAILRSADYGETWEATPLPFKIGGNMPGRGIGERLQVDPNDNDVLYFGAEQGEGLWRSTDRGETFAPVTSFPNVGDFAPDADSDNSYLRSNLGVLWTAFDEASSRPGAPTQTVFTAVADADDILYRSDDAGATWRPVPGAPTGFIPQRGIVDADGRFLYIATSDTSGPYDGSDGEVWRYGIDDGTWTDITPTQRPTGGDFGFSGLAVDASDPDTVMVVSQIQWWPDVLIFRSTDRGETWSTIWDIAEDGALETRYEQSVDDVPWLTFGSDPTPPAAGVQPSPKLGWMISSFEIDPFDSDTAMYGTGATIYRTDDLTAWDEPGGTVHLAPAADGIEETAIQDLVAPAGDVDLVSAMLDLGGFVHDDIDTVPQSYRDPYFGGGTSVDAAGLASSELVRAGTTGDGRQVVALSTDSGETWREVVTEADATGPGTVAISADGSSILWAPAGAAPLVSLDGGETWGDTAGLPAGARVEADRVDADLIYGFAGRAFFRSDDAGASFRAVDESTLPGEGPVRFAAMPSRAGEIWFAGGEEDGAYGMWRSTDGGDSWRTVSGFDEADTVGFGRAAPGADAPAIYTAARRDGVRGVFRSIDDGRSWTRINDDAHQWGWIGAGITGDPDVFGRVYIATNGRGIIVGDDAGASAPEAWSADAVYRKGDAVTFAGSTWRAPWWTRGDEPGSARAPWEEIRWTAGGLSAWTPTRVFGRGDIVELDDELWRARWYTRGDEPGSARAPWEPIA
ncbi:carbohydrate-binding protein [Microbacterium karelineae]|uniref:carbohydrate-binding protein n=1 Tax=Microbacterium karelineae TaxID=2654283 RepID=UPI0012EAD08B|nr:carbohydrate-binding protein [Microbacterium karelineae]